MHAVDVARDSWYLLNTCSREKSWCTQYSSRINFPFSPLTCIVSPSIRTLRASNRCRRVQRRPWSATHNVNRGKRNARRARREGQRRRRQQRRNKRTSAASACHAAWRGGEKNKRVLYGRIQLTPRRKRMTGRGWGFGGGGGVSHLPG